MLNRVKAPFTDEEVEALNFYQTHGNAHPFTCCSYNGCNRDEHNGGMLIANNKGWVCPCGKYKQKWAYEEMFAIIRGVYGVTVDWVLKWDDRDLGNVMKSEECRFIGNGIECLKFIKENKPV